MFFTRLSLFAFFVFAIVGPSSVSALEGIGPRITVTGTVQEIHISEKQQWDEKGGELVLKATNGQLVTVVLQDLVQIVSEGRMRRSSLLPINITKGMQVRARGWRIDTQSISASLVVITNIEKNPALSMSGILQAIGPNTIDVLIQDGSTRTFRLTNDTTVNIAYELTGLDAISLTNKQVLLTLNPDDTSMVRIIRITGNKDLVRGQSK